MKTKVVSVIALLICLFNAYDVKADALEMMFNSKDTLSVMFRQNPGINERDKDIYKYRSIEFFLNNKDKSMDFWRENRDAYINLFLNSIGHICVFQRDCASVVNNDIYLKILLELLKEDKYANRAIEMLINNTSYAFLYKNSEQIKNVLNQVTIDKKQKQYLLALLNLSQKEIDSLQKEELPIEIKARLGDLKLRDSLKTLYLQANNYEANVKALNQLLYTGSADLIKFVLSHFYDPVYQMGYEGCIEEAIRYPILKGLQKHFPQEPFINCQADYFYYRRLRSPAEDKVRILYERMNSWAKEKYNLELNSSNCKPILMEPCRK